MPARSRRPIGSGGIAPVLLWAWLGLCLALPAWADCPQDVAAPQGLRGAPGQLALAAFNIQVFGQAKAAKPEVMRILAQTIAQFDLVAIQEIKDLSQTALPDLEAAVDEQGRDYAWVVSPRLGPSGSAEQYAIMYRGDTLVCLESAVFPDDDEPRLFQRPPLVAHMRALAGDFSFVLAVLHVDPDLAPAEISALPQVLAWAQARFPDERDFIIMGDLNADGAYFNEHDPACPLRGPPYQWLIPNQADTTVAASSNTYDRIIITRGAVEDFSGRAGVFRFDLAWGLSLEQARDCSDHYPVFATFIADQDTDSQEPFVHQDPAPPPQPPTTTTTTTTSTTTTTTSPPPVSGMYHGNVQSKVFHRPGCRYYNCKNCTALFSTRQAALAAGYAPCGVCKP